MPPVLLEDVSLLRHLRADSVFAQSQAKWLRFATSATAVHVGVQQTRVDTGGGPKDAAFPSRSPLPAARRSLPAHRRGQLSSAAPHSRETLNSLTMPTPACVLTLSKFET